MQRQRPTLVAAKSPLAPAGTNCRNAKSRTAARRRPLRFTDNPFEQWPDRWEPLLAARRWPTKLIGNRKSAQPHERLIIQFGRQKIWGDADDFGGVKLRVITPIRAIHVHLVAKEPNQHGRIKRRGWLAGSEALELLPLIGLGHLPGELLKHAAQRCYAGGLCGGEVIRPTVQRTIPNDSSHDSRHPVDRHQIFLLIPLHAECIQ